jgi:hypothetical protein
MGGRVRTVKIQEPKEILKGITGNIYDVKDKISADFLKNLKARQGISSVLESWFTD